MAFEQLTRFDNSSPVLTTWKENHYKDGKHWRHYFAKCILTCTWGATPLNKHRHQHDNNDRFVNFHLQKRLKIVINGKVQCLRCAPLLYALRMSTWGEGAYWYYFASFATGAVLMFSKKDLHMLPVRIVLGVVTSALNERSTKNRQNNPPWWLIGGSRSAWR